MACVAVHLDGNVARMDDKVSELVQAAMKSAHTNLERLSAETGIPRVTLGRRLKQGYSFTIDELERVADALDVDLLDLIPPRGTRRVIKAVSA